MNIKIELVQNAEDLRVWHGVFSQIFTDPEDRISYERFLSWFQDSGVDKHYLIRLDGVLAGFKSIALNKEIRAGWTFYGGVLEQFRGLGLYPEASRQINEILKSEGIQILVFECENPIMMKNAKKKELAIKRLKTFTNKLDYQFILDDSVRYLRTSAPVDGQQRHIQDYYLLGFQRIDPTFSLDIVESKISNQDYKKVYKLLAVLEYGSLLEAKRSMAYPKFIEEVDAKLIQNSTMLNQDNLEVVMERF